MGRRRDPASLRPISRESENSVHAAGMTKARGND